MEKNINISEIKIKNIYPFEGYKFEYDKNESSEKLDESIISQNNIKEIESLEESFEKSY